MTEFLVVYLPGILIVGGLLMMIAFGIKNAGPRLRGQGKLAIAAFSLPIIVFALVYVMAADDKFVMATIMTAIVMVLSGLLALVIAGVRGLVK